MGVRFRSPAFRQSRLAVDTISLVTAWAFRNMPVTAVVAIIDEQNTPSRRTVERSGLTLEGLAQPWEHAESGYGLRYVLPAPQ